MYLHGERCANCGGKFDDTYKAEPYNTTLNPYRIAPDPALWPYFCSERCKDGAIDRKEIIRRHEHIFDDFEKHVYDEARDFDRLDIYSRAEVERIAKGLKQEIDDAARTRDQSITSEIDQRYTAFFSDYARLINEKSGIEAGRLIDGEESYLATPRPFHCTIDAIRSLTPIPPIYENTVKHALMPMGTVTRKGAFYSHNPAQAYADLIALCVRQFPNLAFTTRQPDTLPIADVSALDASPDPYAFLRSVYDLFQSTAEGHESLTRYYLRTFVRGTPDMTDDELWKRIDRSTPVKDVANAIFKGSAFGPNMIIQHEAPIELDDHTRQGHTHIVGPTGSGKTTIMQRDILTDLHRDNPPGMIIVEPKGTMCQRLRSLKLFEGPLQKRLIVIDAADPKRLPALNLFAPLNSPENVRKRIEGQTIDLLSYIFSTEDVALTGKQAVGFSFIARLLFNTPKANLSSLLRLTSITQAQFTSSEFGRALKGLDTTTQHFFTYDFFKGFSETKEQIRHRALMVLRSDELRAMFDAPHRSIDWLDVIQNRKIVLVNTGSSVLDEATHQMIGRYVIASVVAAVSGRYFIPKSEWHPCYLYIDEANLFVDPHKTEKMLAMSREFCLGITLAHQSMTSAAVNDTIRASISTNTGIKYAASVEGTDLRAAAQDLRCEPDFIRSQTVTKTHVNFACYVRNHPYGKAFSSSAVRGNVERMPQIDPDEASYILDENQFVYCQEDVNDLEEFEEPERPEDDPDYF